eukprot:SAG22_NODE_8190_length_676_cov_0.684575_1_plen_185_part_01
MVCPQLVAQACLFLAGKAEDTPKKLAAVILEAHKLWQSQAAKNGGAAAGSEEERVNSAMLKEDSEEFKKMKERVLKAERDLLHTSRFDLNIVHAYKFIMQYVKQLNGSRDLAQVAWSFYNDRCARGLKQPRGPRRMQPQHPPSQCCRSSSRPYRRLTVHCLALVLSLRTQLCLRYPSQRLAVGVI